MPASFDPGDQQSFVVDALTMNIYPAPGRQLGSSCRIFYLVGMVAMYIKKWLIQHADQEFKIGIRKIPATEDDIYVCEPLFDMGAVQSIQLYIAYREKFHFIFQFQLPGRRRGLLYGKCSHSKSKFRVQGLCSVQRLSTATAALQTHLEEFQSPARRWYLFRIQALWMQLLWLRIFQQLIDQWNR